ncbi:CHAD domain-containing protein [Streptomyces sp. NPDC058417]|uniref:CHAD domain-containing protein n=1 Tax=unclassified Streptomyces TaxID=2593676 RepID=UPI003659B79A
MAQRHHDLTDHTAGPDAPTVTGEALAGYLRSQATEFLRALRLHRETGGGSPNGAAAGGPGQSVDAARALRRSARRISGSLHTFRPLLDPGWSEEIRPELAWLSGTLALEHSCEARLERLLLALHRLSGAPPAVPAAPVTVTVPVRPPVPAQAGGSTGTPGTAGASGATGATKTAGTPGSVDTAGPAGTGAAARSRTTTATDPRTGTATRTGPDPRDATAAAVPAPSGVSTRLPVTPRAGSAGSGQHPAVPDRGNLTVGAAKAGALLDRQLTLARTRAHSTALQALGSSRFHAVADKVAVLASEVPLAPHAAATDPRPLAAAAEDRLADAVAALPLLTAGHPYNAEALVHGLSPEPTPHPQDAPWHQVRLLLRLHRYALEVVLGADTPPDVRLLAAGEALDRHRDASEAAAAAAHAARTPRIAPATAYALGVLHADQRHEVEAARYAFQRAWQRQTD